MLPMRLSEGRISDQPLSRICIPNENAEEIKQILSVFRREKPLQWYRSHETFCPHLDADKYLLKSKSLIYIYTHKKIYSAPSEWKE